MSSSILTNAGAMTALQTLKQTNKNLTTTQNRISTGLKINNAKEGASFWAVASVMRSDVNAFKALADNLSLAENSTSVARDGAQQIVKLIDKIKAETTAAQEGSIDKQKLQANVDAMLSQIGEITKSANFNGVNLLQSNQPVKLVSSLARDGASVDASYITFDSIDLRLTTGGALDQIADLNVLDRGDVVLANDTDGVRNAQFAVGATNAGQTVTINYTDGKGEAKAMAIELKTNVAANGGSAMATQLLGSSEFTKYFTAVGSGNNVVISPKNREFSGLKVDSVSFAGAAAVADTTLARTSSVTFVDKQPLEVGETIVLNYKSEGVDKRVTLKVVADPDVNSGDSLGTDSEGWPVLALDDAVSIAGVVGTDIAAEVRTALATLTDFDGAANHLTVGGGVTATVSLTAAATDTNAEIYSVSPPATDYDVLLDRIEVGLNAAIDAAAAFGAAQTRVEIQKEFLDSLIDNLKIGIGTLVDADMNEESARLQALQVQQQLGIQSLSIANQAPQALLSLFRS